MKLVIADRLGVWVHDAFDGNARGMFVSIAGSLAYTFQIYHDFAGYSYVAYGISLLFGLQISQNFSLPYFAHNISDFWRRWHMSLSSWLRDYVYIPLGGNRKGALRKYLNLMIIFVICAIWHGRGMHFVAWGLLHGFYNVADQFFRKRGWKYLYTGITGTIVTFISVSMAWIFFRAESVSVALRVIRSMFLGGFDFDVLFTTAKIRFFDCIVLVVACIFAGFMEYKAYKRGTNVPEYVGGQTIFCKCCYVYVLIVLIAVFGVYGADGVDPIYMQF